MPFRTPPLGIIPRSFWVGQRITDLACAIQRQMAPSIGNPDMQLISKWSKEILELTENA